MYEGTRLGCVAMGRLAVQLWDEEGANVSALCAAGAVAHTTDMFRRTLCTSPKLQPIRCRRSNAREGLTDCRVLVVV